MFDMYIYNKSLGTHIKPKWYIPTDSSTNALEQFDKFVSNYPDVTAYLVYVSTWPKVETTFKFHEGTDGN